MESRSTQDARRDFAALIETVLRGEHIELTLRRLKQRAENG